MKQLIECVPNISEGRDLKKIKMISSLVEEVEGVKLQVITTPGHTPGSVSYYSDQGFLFSGDTLFRGSIGRTDLPEGDYNQEMQSICEKLFQLPDETNVLPGHMSETTIGFERQNNPFVQNWLKSLK